MTCRFVGDYSDPRGFDVSGQDDPELVTVIEATEEVGIPIPFDDNRP